MFVPTQKKGVLGTETHSKRRIVLIKRQLTHFASLQKIISKKTSQTLPSRPPAVGFVLLFF